jgi:glucose-1-phosphate cytidylyltransferase
MNQVPVLILAGGLGTRLSEETVSKPKPMVEIGDIPILLHIMRFYYSHGFNDFVICAGYKSWEIKSFFLNYAYRRQHLELDIRTPESEISAFGGANLQEKWRVRVLDTGSTAMTGARVARTLDILEKDDFDDFALTYGDGLCNVNLREELSFHQSHKKLGTILGVKPMARFGELELGSEDYVAAFREKPQGSGGYINGGFFFLRRGFRKYLRAEDDCVLEQAPLVNLASDRQLVMFRHDGFWQPMDTLRDKQYLQNLWESGDAPWVLRAPESGPVITEKLQQVFL